MDNSQKGASLPPPTYDEAIGSGPSPQTTYHTNDSILQSVQTQPSSPQPQAQPQPQPNTYFQQLSVESTCSSCDSTVPQDQLPTITTTTVYVNQTSMGPKPVHMKCPHCFQESNTQVKYVNGILTWIIFFGTLIFGCWLGCCLIPFYMKSCKDVEHYCDKCKAFIGVYKRV